MKSLLIVLGTLFLFGGMPPANAASVTGTLSITVAPPALALVINPSSASLACNAAAGTVVSNASVTGGDGNPITYSMAPAAGGSLDASFAINASTGVVTVGSGGILPGDCNTTGVIYNITASQP